MLGHDVVLRHLSGGKVSGDRKKKNGGEAEVEAEKDYDGVGKDQSGEQTETEAVVLLRRPATFEILRALGAELAQALLLV